MTPSEKRVTQLNKKITTLKDKIAKWELKKTKLTAKLRQYDPASTDYHYTEYDIKETDCDIARANKEIAKAEQDLEVANAKLAKENSLSAVDCPILDEFLDQWFKKSLEYLHTNYDEYQQFKQDIRTPGTEAYIKFIEPINNASAGRTVADTDERIRLRKRVDKYIANTFDSIVINASGRPSVEDYFIEELTNEKRRKREDFIQRLTKVIGTITDCSGLYIGIDGNINGIAIGTTGKAKVETIGAGGYAVQRYHYRVLIHKH